MTNKEKFLSLVSKEQPNTLEKNAERIRNRAMLRESQQIAIKVLKRLDELNWTQKDLASAMEVTPQQVNKIVKGQENLTLETQCKLQAILNIPILASYYEAKMNSMENWVLSIESRVQQLESTDFNATNNYSFSATYEKPCSTLTTEFSFN